MLLRSQQRLIWQDNFDFNLDNKHIHVWYININDYINSIPELISKIDKQETKRAHQFKFDKDRNCFICSHAILRILLGKYCNCDTTKITYDYTVNNKPILTYDKNLHFNLSHSSHRAIIAFTKNRPIGIDIEYMQEKETLDNLAKRFFSSQEYNEYKLLPEQHKTQGFYNAWTRKEAVVKAIGIGITCSLKSFSINLTPGSKAKLLSMHNQNDVTNWQLYGFNPEEKYCAAIAWHGPQKMILGHKTDDLNLIGMR